MDASVQPKVCRDCKVAKPLSEFYRYPNGWIHSYCRPCHNARTRRYAKAHPEWYRKQTREDNARARQHRKVWRLGRRAQALAALGGKCVRCGFDDPRALQIDHINGGGHKERLGGLPVATLHGRIIAGKTDGYQLLCANCNWIKRYEQGEHRSKP